MFMGLVANSSGEQSVQHCNKPCHSHNPEASCPSLSPPIDSVTILTQNDTKLDMFSHPKRSFKGALPDWVWAPHNLLADDFDLDAEEMLPFAALSHTPGTGPGLPQRSTAILCARLTTSLQGASWSLGVLPDCVQSSALFLLYALPAQCPGLSDSGKEGCLRQGAPPISFTHDSAYTGREST